MPREVVPMETRPGAAFRHFLHHAMGRKEHVRAVADEEVARLPSTPAASSISISLSSAAGSITRPLPMTACLPGPQNAARNQLQDELLVADEDGVAGVVAALVARHDVEAFGEEIDDLPLALVAPLGAQDDYVSHFDQTYLFYRTRAHRRSGNGKADPVLPGIGQSVIRLHFMQISEVYLGLGQDAFAQLIRGISIGKLKTYQIYEGFKVRAHLTKVNTESLRKAVPKLWERISAGDEDFAKDLAQAILVSHLDMIAAVLDFLGVPHENGFFAKDMDAKPYFTDGWEERVREKFRGVYPEAILLFYVNHLRWELLGATEVYRPASPSAA